MCWLVVVGVAPQSWELFGDAILTGLLLATLLPVLGVVLVLRHQLFLAASIGQAASFGIAVSLWLGLGTSHGTGLEQDESVALLFGLLFAIGTAVMSMRALSVQGATIEARAVWIFLFAGSGAMLLLADAPHGLQEIQRLFLSSLLGASRQDVYVGAGLLAVGLAFALPRRRRILLWAMDPLSAQVYGTSRRACDVLVGGFVGAAIGFAIHATGLTFTFGCTVLPVLFARACAGSLTAVLWMAPGIGLLGCCSGFVVADRSDLPPGQATVAVLAVGVAIAHLAVAVVRRLRRG